MFVYVLGLGAPEHPLPADSWEAVGCELPALLARRGHRPPPRLRAVVRPPVQPYLDRLSRHPATRRCARPGLDYFENSRRATYANAPIASPIRCAGTASRKTSGASPRATGRAISSCRSKARRANSSVMRRAARWASPTSATTARWRRQRLWAASPSRPRSSFPAPKRCAASMATGSTANTGSSTRSTPASDTPTFGWRPGQSIRRTAGMHATIWASIRDRSCSRPPITGTNSSGGTCARNRRSAAGSRWPGSRAAGWAAESVSPHAPQSANMPQ